MPYAKNGDINIYYEVEGEGIPLVLVHGATDNMDMFRRTGWVSALKDNYKLILIDVRGHGKSDKPHDMEQYGSEMAVKMAEDVVTVLDDLGIAHANYFGYSMGAMIGYRVARLYQNRFKCFILGGMSPYKYPEPRVKINTDFAETLRASLGGMESALSYREKNIGRALTDEERGFFTNWIKGKDVYATVAVLMSMIDVTPLSDDDLSNITIPVLVFAGELDLFHEGAKQSAEYLQQSQFISLPDIDHGPGFTQLDTLLPPIKEFLETANI